MPKIEKERVRWRYWYWCILPMCFARYFNVHFKVYVWLIVKLPLLFFLATFHRSNFQGVNHLAKICCSDRPTLLTFVRLIVRPFFFLVTFHHANFHGVNLLANFVALTAPIFYTFRRAWFWLVTCMDAMKNNVIKHFDKSGLYLIT